MSVKEEKDLEKNLDALLEENEDDWDDAEQSIVVITDEEGNEAYYCEELVLPIGEDRFALLVPTCMDEEVPEKGDLEEDEAFFAKIIVDENGEDAYVEPSDEEFKQVCAAYEKLMDEEEGKK